MLENIKNIPEFKKLIERYETITLEEIEKECKKSSVRIQRRLTGAGSVYFCTLCRSVGAISKGNPDCDKCVYSLFNGLLFACEDTPTYEELFKSKKPKEILKAYRSRAAWMREFAKEKGIE